MSNNFQHIIDGRKSKQYISFPVGNNFAGDFSHPLGNSLRDDDI